MPVNTWLKKVSTYRDAFRRAGFAFLTLWIHAAVLFYVTMVLFAGHKIGSKTPNEKPPHIVQISLANPTPPDTPPNPPEQPAAPQPDLTANGTVPASEQSTPSPPAQTKAEHKPSVQMTSPDEGVLDCDSLDKRPERIVLGPSYLDLPPNDNLSGELVIKMKIHRDGTVLRMTVESSTMAPRVQDRVMQWVGSSLFRPGEMGGVPVDCEMRFDFSLTPPGKTQ